LGLFKKKKKNTEVFLPKDWPKNKEPSLLIQLEDIPYEAVNMIYSKKMSEYENARKDSIDNGKADMLQKELLIISRHLQNSSASASIYSSVDAETESIYKYFMDLVGIPRSDLLNADIENLKRMKKAHEELKIAFADLTKVDEPETINLNIKIDIPDTKIDEPEPKKKQEDDLKYYHEEENKKHWQGFKKLIHPDNEKHDIDLEQVKQLKSMTKNDDIKQRLEDLEKEKQAFLKATAEPTQPPKTSFFKKRKLVNSDSPLPDKKLRKQEKAIQKEYLCLDCSHNIKDHTNGCKCGCMTTIDEIKEQHNIIKTKMNLDVIEPDLPIDESDGLHNKLTDEEEVDIEKLMKQVKQTESMIKQSPTSQSQPVLQPLQPPSPTSQSPGFGPALQPPKQQIIAPQVKETQCTCDHYRSEHYEGKFCLQCNCSKFTPYPNEQKK